MPLLSPEQIAKLPSTKIGLREPVEQLRQDALNLQKKIFALRDRHAGGGTVHGIATDEDRSEGIANVMLAYRHIEDARMRLGKVLQAADGGVSVYDK